MVDAQKLTTAARIDEELRHRTLEEQLEYVMREVNTEQPVKGYMKFRPLSDYARKKLEEYNAAHPDKPFFFDHIKGGFWSCDVKHAAQALDEPLTMEDFLRIAGLSTWLYLRARSRL